MPDGQDFEGLIARAGFQETTATAVTTLPTKDQVFWRSSK